MKLDKIYTRTGDDGKTSLGDGSRLPKFHIRVTAYGSVDEANSVIGMAILHVNDSDVNKLLLHIQNDLFDIGADLCRPEQEGAERQDKGAILRVTQEQVAWLESRIDLFNARARAAQIASCYPAAALLRHICITPERSLDARKGMSCGWLWKRR